MGVCTCVCPLERAYRVCAEHCNNLGQGHVPQLISESSGHQSLRGMEDMVLHYEETDNTHNKHTSIYKMKHTSVTGTFLSSVEYDEVTHGRKSYPTI